MARTKNDLLFKLEGYSLHTSTQPPRRYPVRIRHPSPLALAAAYNRTVAACSHCQWPLLPPTITLRVFWPSFWNISINTDLTILLLSTCMTSSPINRNTVPTITNCEPRYKRPQIVRPNSQFVSITICKMLFFTICDNQYKFSQIVITYWDLPQIQSFDNNTWKFVLLKNMYRQECVFWPSDGRQEVDYADKTIVYDVILHSDSIGSEKPSTVGE